jgi:hypothetical protein
MTDIVERLRIVEIPTRILYDEAADEIERLRRENAELELECAAWKESSALKMDKIKRLREALQQIAEGTWSYERHC